MDNFLTQFCSLRLTMLLLLLMIQLTVAANATTVAANDTTVAANDTTVAAENECQTSFQEDLGSLLDVTVADTDNLNTREFKIVMKKEGNFSSIFTGNCTVDNIPGMSVEYRLQESADWSQVDLEVIEETEIKEGKVRLDVGEELNYCQKYEMKLKVNNNNDTMSDIIKFGPLKEKFTSEELKALDEDIAAIDRIDMSFNDLKDKFNATWGNICAKSLRILLKKGTDPKTTVYETRTNLTESNFDHYIVIPTKPCTEYHLELESFLAPDPGTKKHGTYYGGKHYFISSPQQETFGHIEMEEKSTSLSWDLREYFKHENNKSVPICVLSQTLSYNITFGLIGGEKHILKESKSPKVNTNETLDIGKAIKNKKIKHLEKFCPYEVKMEISYEIKTNKKQTNKKMVRHFSKYLITNSGGNISAATKPILKLDDFNLKVLDISQNSTCLNKSYKFDCWLADKNQSSSLNKTAPTDTINVFELTFEAGSELKCRVKIEYKTAGGNQSIIETQWSKSIKLTVPDPPTSSTGTIVGVVIFVLLLAGGALGAVVYYRRKHSSVDVASRTHSLSYGSH